MDYAKGRHLAEEIQVGTVRFRWRQDEGRQFSTIFFFCICMNLTELLVFSAPLIYVRKGNNTDKLIKFVL